jgi:soluble lytic murein transglycosylase-like protein
MSAVSNMAVGIGIAGNGHRQGVRKMVKRRESIACILILICLLPVAPALVSPSDLSLQAIAELFRAPRHAASVPSLQRPAADDVAAAELQAIRSLARLHMSKAPDDRLDALADAIFQESSAAGVDPLMVAAIVAQESSFRSGVVSRAGAVGLMQLRPFVARDIAERAELEWQGLTTLHHPEKNLRLGIHYYSELVDRFEGDVHLALAAYNRGPTRISRQVRSGEEITSRYADRILGLYRDLDAKRISVLRSNG